MADRVDSLSDTELRTKLAENGFPVMPITSSTRPLLVQKLKVVLNNKSKLKDSDDNRRSLAAGEETIVITAKPETVKRRSSATVVLPQTSGGMPRSTRRKNKVPTNDSVVKIVSKVATGSTVIKDTTVKRDTVVDKNTKDENKLTVEEDNKNGSESVEEDNEKGSESAKEDNEGESESRLQSPKTTPDKEQVEYMEWE